MLDEDREVTTKKKRSLVLELVETTHNAPRKSSFLHVGNKVERKRSVTIISPKQEDEESSCTSDEGN